MTRRPPHHRRWILDHRWWIPAFAVVVLPAVLLVIFKGQHAFETPEPALTEVFVKRGPLRPQLVGKAPVLAARQVGPRRPARVVSPRVPTPAASQYPILLNPVYRSQTQNATPPHSTERYRQALGIYQRLRRQSDPWMRLVATDLMARCYTQLEQWSSALRMYQDMAGEFGQGTDGSGLPIDLGTRLAIADIHARRGEMKAYVAGYLEIYEQLVDRHYVLPESLRGSLSRVTREALATHFAAPRAQHGVMFERFVALRRREALELTRAALLPSRVGSGGEKNGS